MRQRTHLLFLTVLVCLLSAPGLGGSPNKSKPPFLPGNVSFTDVEPTMDGRATGPLEWEKALVIPDSFFFGSAWRAGFYYFQSRIDWTAKSIETGAEATYTGQTSFVAHDIIGSGNPKNDLHYFRVNENNDWNSFAFEVPGGKATLWVFDDVDDPDDDDWIMASEGLQISSLIPEGAVPNRIDDRGFIARLNGDPKTDVHWLPGMAEPGEAGWVWEDWHYVFGRRTYGQSYQDVGTDPDAENAVDHEVYEFCAHNPDPQDPWCLWWEVEKEKTLVPHFTTEIIDHLPTTVVAYRMEIVEVPILKGDFWLHFWNPPPTTEPGVPTVTWQIGFIIQVIQQKAQGAGGAAADHLWEALGAFESAFYDGLLGLDPIVGGDRGILFRELKRAYKFLKKAKKAGIPPEDLIDVEMQALSLVSQFALDIEIEIDRAGATIDDKDLLKASKGFYKFGKALRKHGNKGLKGKTYNVIKKLKRVYKILDARR